MAKRIIIPVSEELVADFREKLSIIKRDIAALMKRRGFTNKRLAKHATKRTVISEHNELVLTSVDQKIESRTVKPERILTALTLAAGYALELERAIDDGRLDSGLVYLIAAQSVLLSAAGLEIGLTLGKAGREIGRLGGLGKNAATTEAQEKVRAAYAHGTIKSRNEFALLHHKKYGLSEKTARNALIGEPDPPNAK